MPKPVKQLKKSNLKAQAEGREIVYAEPMVTIAAGENSISVEFAKQLLGWEETSDKEKTLFTDIEGKRIFCSNNVNNRPLYSSVYSTLSQEILMGRWKLNGENIIIGKTGLILNGQHTLIALVMAEQERTVGKNSDHWTKLHAEELTLDKLIVFGINEEDSVINTMDTCKPRSLADVIYRSEFFAKMKTGDRKIAAKLADHAVRFLWSRTGAGDAFSLRRTHAESLAFIQNHPRLLECVKHIHEENEKSAIGKYVSPGYASGLMYLMATSNTDADGYFDTNEQNEASVDFTHMDKAQEFWVFLSKGDPAFKPLREALGMLANESTGVGGTFAEKMAIIARAWALFVTDQSITSAPLKLDYLTGEDGIRTLAEVPQFGGIDKGDRKDSEKDDTDNDDDDKGPTAEEIEAEKAKIRSEAAKAKSTTVPVPPAATVKTKPAKVSAAAAATTTANVNGSAAPELPKPKAKSKSQLMNEKREAEAMEADRLRGGFKPRSTTAKTPVVEIPENLMADQSEDITNNEIPY